MKIYSVTEHINNLNNQIDKHVEFINNVKRMRWLQILLTKDEPHFKLGNGNIQLQGELQVVEEFVDDFLSKGTK
jgi:hypothetical protein